MSDSIPSVEITDTQRLDVLESAIRRYHFWTLNYDSEISLRQQLDALVRLEQAA
jgi:hypothetical protein